MATCKVTELVPTANNRVSYGHKANVAFYPDGTTVLYSYSTAVCEIDKDGNFKRTWNGWSATTSNHVHDFLLTYSDTVRGFSKNEWLDLPVYRSSYPNLPFKPRYKVTYPLGFNAGRLYW